MDFPEIQNKGFEQNVKNKNNNNNITAQCDSFSFASSFIHKRQIRCDLIFLNSRRRKKAITTATIFFFSFIFYK